MDVTCEFLCREQLKQYVIFISKPSKLIRTNKVSNELYFLRRRRTILQSAPILFFVVAKSAPILVFFGCKPIPILVI